ncbi:hypothetical protein RMATCC62417_14568 [Rhizopus microsporus]|nr:hypothetical protein RMATCC62417_14568 [Rhizopus microsporus]
MNRYNKNGFAVEEDNNSAILDFSNIEQQPMLNDQDETIYNDPHTPTNRPKAWKQLFPRLLLFIIIGVVSLLFSLSLANSILDIGLPRTLEDVQAVAVKLDNMLSTSWTGYESVTIVFAVLYLWQQAFSIPGSVLLNLLAGYLYGIVMGTIWTSLLTAGGATLAYGLAILVLHRLEKSLENQQFLMRSSDDDVSKYLRMFTLLSPNEIKDIMDEHQKSPELRIAQTKLANETTELVHGCKHGKGQSNLFQPMDYKEHKQLHVSCLDKQIHFQAIKLFKPLKGTNIVSLN